MTRKRDDGKGGAPCARPLSLPSPALPAYSRSGREALDNGFYLGLGVAVLLPFLQYASPTLPRSVAWAGVIAGCLVMAAEFFPPEWKPPLLAVILFLVGAGCFGAAVHFYLGRSAAVKEHPPEIVHGPSKVELSVQRDTQQRLVDQLKKEQAILKELAEETMGTRTPFIAYADAIRRGTDPGNFDKGRPYRIEYQKRLQSLEGQIVEYMGAAVGAESLYEVRKAHRIAISSFLITVIVLPSIVDQAPDQVDVARQRYNEWQITYQQYSTALYATIERYTAKRDQLDREILK
jgi:hypothetical protein